MTDLHRGKVLWFTGLSGSGKSTLAVRVRSELSSRGHSVKLLDGDVIRKEINGHLDFSPEGIRRNNESVAGMCWKYLRDHEYVLVAVIAPFRDARARAREALGEAYVEVYMKASLEEVALRDVKGLYRKAFSGELKGVIGVCPEVPYEEPEYPELTIDTGRMSVDGSVKVIMDHLQKGDRE